MKQLKNFKVIFNSRRLMTSLFLLWCVVLFIVTSSKFNVESHNKFGDSHTLMNVVSASQHFSNEGFTELSFTPKIFSKISGECCGEVYYTHFTPLPYLVGGVLWNLGARSLKPFRYLSLLTGLIFLFLVFLSISQIEGRFAGMVVAVFISVTHPFLSVHLSQVMNLASLFMMLSFYLVILYTQNKVIKNSCFHLFLIFSSSFLNFFSTFEMIFFGQILISLYLFLFSHKFFWKLSLVVGGSYIFAFVTKLISTSFALGGIGATVLDLKKAFLWRSLEVGSKTNYFLELAGGFPGYPEYMGTYLVKHFNLGSTLLYLFLFVIVGFLIISSKLEKEVFKRYFKYILILFIAPLSWALIFPQHNVIHINSLTIRHWELMFGVIFGGSLVIGLNFLVSSKRKVTLVIGLGLTLTSLSFLHNNLSKSKKFLKQAESLNWNVELKELRRISNLLEENSLIVTNDNIFQKVHFLHFPQNIFNLKPFSVLFNQNISQIDYSKVCSKRKCYILLKEKNPVSWSLKPHIKGDQG